MQRPTGFVMVFLACGLGLGACSTGEAPEPAASADDTSANDVREIDGIQTIRERFNADVGRPRFMTILSST